MSQIFILLAVKNHTGLFNEDTIEDVEETPVRPTTLQIPTSCYHRRHSSPSALGEGHVFHYPTVDTSTTCSTTDSELDRNNDSEILFSSSLKRSRNRVNSNPTKPQGERESSLGSQIWSNPSRQTSEYSLSSQTWPRPAQYNSEGDSLSQPHCINQDKKQSTEYTTQVLERSELREKKLRHGLENTVESIPVITMNSSTTETLNRTSEIDANNNPSPLLGNASIYSKAYSNGSANSVVNSNGKVFRSKESHVKDKSVNGSINKDHNSKQRNIKNNIKENYTKDSSVNHSNTKEKKQSKSSVNSLHCGFSLGLERSKELPEKRPNSCPKTVGKHKPDYLQTTPQENPSPKHSKARSQSLLERRKGGKEVKYGLSTSSELKPKRKFSFPRPLSPRLNSSSPKPAGSPGAVVTSSRVSKRRTSVTAAAAAFAAATAGAPCSPSSPLTSSHARFSFRKYGLNNLISQEHVLPLHDLTMLNSTVNSVQHQMTLG